MKTILISIYIFLASCLAAAQSSAEFEVVLEGGRVIDPETGLDAIRNIGIVNGRIAEISSDKLTGKNIVNASGLVVAPGFIDIHVHGVTNKDQEFKVRDGVTTALELEWGIPMIRAWYKSRDSNALINYGASANWPYCRTKSFTKYLAGYQAVQQSINQGNYTGIAYSTVGVSEVLDADQHTEMIKNIRESLNSGALGIGAAVGYVTGATREELFRINQLAGELEVPIFIHVRAPNTMAIQQAISDAVLTNAPLHIVHINSMSLGEIDLALEMVHSAQKRGFDVTTELYPYTAASTGLESAFLDEGWQDRLGIDYSDLQWVATGERLTEETFKKYRKEGGQVIIHMMKPEWIRTGIASENVIIASDGMPYAPLAHPRTAGTFSRVLGNYVRQEQLLSLIEALSKMTILPAKRLEIVAPSMRLKGRMQVGCDADITIFNPETIIDKASFEDGLKFSEGIVYVLVNGEIVVNQGKTVEGLFPGKPIFGKYRK